MNTEVTNESIERKDAKVLLDEANESKITFTDKVVFSNGRDKAEISVVSEAKPEGGKDYKSILDISNTNNIDIGELKAPISSINKEEFQRLLISTGATLLN